MSDMVGALRIFPHIQKEAVISLKTFKTKSAKGESLLNDFAPVSLLNIKTHHCLFISLYCYLFRVFFFLPKRMSFHVRNMQRLTNGYLSWQGGM